MPASLSVSELESSLNADTEVAPWLIQSVSLSKALPGPLCCSGLDLSGPVRDDSGMARASAEPKSVPVW